MKAVYFLLPRPFLSGEGLWGMIQTFEGVSWKATVSHQPGSVTPSSGFMDLHTWCAE